MSLIYLNEIKFFEPRLNVNLKCINLKLKISFFKIKYILRRNFFKKKE